MRATGCVKTIVARRIAGATAALLLLALAPAASAAMFTVVSAEGQPDPAQGMGLHEAIEAAKATADGPDEILFDSSVTTIALRQSLPLVTGMTIDGRDAAGEPGVLLTTAPMFAFSNGLVLTGAPSTIRGLAIGSGFDTAILVTSAGNTIESTRLQGTGFVAPPPTPPSRFGVVVGGAAATGTHIVDSVITGFRNAGIFIQLAAGTVVTGNSIGTDAAGTALPNGLGVDIQADGATVGDNVVAHNAFAGIQTAGDGNRVERNQIYANGGGGIAVGFGPAGSSGNVLTENEIDGNTGLGIDLRGPGNGSQSAPTITSVSLPGARSRSAAAWSGRARSTRSSSSPARPAIPRASVRARASSARCRTSRRVRSASRSTPASLPARS